MCTYKIIGGVVDNKLTSFRTFLANNPTPDARIPTTAMMLVTQAGLLNDLTQHEKNLVEQITRLDKNNNIHESKNNYEYRLELNKSYILPDFFIPSLNLILEFDGTYYHRNTTENKKREMIRDENIINSGYKLLHISEKEYNENKELTILKVVNFILKTKQLKNV